MDNSISIRGHCPGGRNLAVLIHLAFLGPDEEHVALLVESRRFARFRRKDNFFAEGVAGVFGLAEGQAELLALCFHAERFTPTQAANWLVERRIRPLLLVPITGKKRASTTPWKRLRGRGLRGSKPSGTKHDTFYHSLQVVLTRSF
jgi:hypothetical protein